MTELSPATAEVMAMWNVEFLALNSRTELPPKHRERIEAGCEALVTRSVR